MLACGLARPAGLAAQAPTTVVVLGVTHSLPLLAESHHPGVLRAWMARVRPSALALEVTPERLSRAGFLDFTYEIQFIGIPWALERGLPVYPFDWEPGREEELLAFGMTFEPAPLVRRARTFHDFFVFRDRALLRLPLFYADSAATREEYRAWYNVAGEPANDFARRLFLYRTSLQAERVRRAAHRHPGGTLLVIVGSYHKDEIERILAADAALRIVQPATFGLPAAAEAATTPADLIAIATFSILGLHAEAGVLDRPWLERVLSRLEAERPDPEVRLLRTRFEVLAGRLEPAAAIGRYQALSAEDGRRFSWTGQIEGRLDSYFDPFGALSVRQRALLEQGRELLRSGQFPEAAALRERLARDLPEPLRTQLGAYWDRFLMPR